MDTNVCTFTGRLGGDPELRRTNDNVVCNFSLAVNGLKDKDALWLRVAAWGKGGEAAAEYLSKGSRVSVTGRLKVREYEHKGEKRTSVELDAAAFGGVIFLDTKGDRTPYQNEDPPDDPPKYGLGNVDPPDDEIPF